jgi:hypothetical protein
MADRIFLMVSSASIRAIRRSGLLQRGQKMTTPKVARARKLQGQYLGALKSLTGEDRARVKKTAAEKSVAEAVKLAQSIKKAKQ